jgi:hypothetical protein
MSKPRHKIYRGSLYIQGMITKLHGAHTKPQNTQTAMKYMQVTREKGHIHRGSPTMTNNTQRDKIHTILTSPDTDTTATEARLLRGPRVAAKGKRDLPHSV